MSDRAEGAASPLPLQPVQPMVPFPRSPVPRPPLAAEPRRVSLTVNGLAVSVPEGATLLQAAQAAGVEIPTLCFLETLTPVNVCRICVVVLEVLASSVDVSTSPQIQRYLEQYGARPERFGPQQEPVSSRDAARAGFHATGDGSRAAAVAQPVKADNDLYIRDYGKCILCYKCVEACGTDAQNTFAISVAGRGFEAHISTEGDVPLPDSACVYCGNCIGVCPTGALMFKTEHDMREAGTWAESRQTVTDTICPYCGVGCDLTVHAQDGQIVRVTSPLDHSVTSGNLCIKGRFGWQFIQIQKA